MSGSIKSRATCRGSSSRHWRPHHGGRMEWAFPPTEYQWQLGCIGGGLESSGGKVTACAFVCSHATRFGPVVCLCPTCLGTAEAYTAIWACRVIDYGAEGLRGVEGRYAELLAILSDAQWPTPRWPVYVFLAGAMVCLFTSSFCHLFACCSWHVAEVRPCCSCLHC